MNSFLLDNDHSELLFSVSHLMLVHTTGKITDFNVQLNWDGKAVQTAAFKMTAKMKSINTLHPFRDQRIKDPDILDAENFPIMEFISTNIESSGNENEYHLFGKFTLKGKTLPLQLKLIATGKAKDSYSGDLKRGFSIEGVIDRRLWGVDFNLPFEGNGVAVGNDIQIRAGLEFIEKNNKAS